MGYIIRPSMKFGISCAYDEALILDYVKDIITLLQERKHNIELEEGLSTLLNIDLDESPLSQMTAEMVLVMGGAATILRAFREIDKNKLPVLGISLGDIGFLAEIEFKDFEKSLQEIEKGNYLVEERTRLAIEIDGEQLKHGLNELTVNAKKSATVIRYALVIDDELIWRDSADGIIVSTPSGSTGYALSAGGPIVSEGANVFVIVPICSLNQTHKPFVVSNTSTVTIQDISSSSKCQAIVDGRVRVDLDSDMVSITKADVPAYFVRLEKEINSRIFHKLRRKFETPDIVPKTAPPSAKFIYTLLKYEGRLTQKEIIEMTMLPARTVRSGINFLLKNGLIMKTSSLRDTRQHIYLIK